MADKIAVKELERDEELGLIKKEIRLPNNLAFETPTKSVKHIKKDEFLDSKSTVNEIIRSIDDDTLKRIESGDSAKFLRDIRKDYKQNKLNLVMFNLKFDKIPETSSLKNLAQLIYTGSESTILLPSVKTGLLKENDKFSDKRVNEYHKMMKLMLEEISAVGNKKVLIGTIPLIPPKYSRPLINMYQTNNITAFAIDSGTKDIVLNEFDFRVILSAISEGTELNKTLIYACNCGYPQFQKHETRADDFLSIFAYVDILGGTFKSKVVPKGIPRTKIFSKENYSYEIFYPKSEEARKLLRIQNILGTNLSTLKNYNQSEQLKESIKVKDITGEEKMLKYLETKKAIDRSALKRLIDIARNVKSILKF